VTHSLPVPIAPRRSNSGTSRERSPKTYLRGRSRSGSTPTWHSRPTGTSCATSKTTSHRRPRMVIIAILLRRLRVLRSDASIWVGVTRFSQLCVPLTDPSPGARGLRQIRSVSARATRTPWGMCHQERSRAGDGRAPTGRHCWCAARCCRARQVGRAGLGRRCC
jgi:hypothetical protein